MNVIHLEQIFHNRTPAKGQGDPQHASLFLLVWQSLLSPPSVADPHHPGLGEIQLTSSFFPRSSPESDPTLTGRRAGAVRPGHRTSVTWPWGWGRGMVWARAASIVLHCTKQAGLRGARGWAPDSHLWHQDRGAAARDRLGSETVGLSENELQGSRGESCLHEVPGAAGPLS